jgi:hypothetical protein
LIDEAMRGIHRSGIAKYMRITGITSEMMPSIIGESDIVLDQFRLGSYGVAACEGMAAGRVVVGHVLPEVRAEVLARTGWRLPIVEATPDTVARVVSELIADPDRCHDLADQGMAFVNDVHSGGLSAATLRKHWIDLPR